MSMAWTIDARKIPVSKLNELGAMQPRVVRLATILGIRPLAGLLGIDSGNLNQMAAGKRNVPEEIGKRLLDLDHVLARALQVFGDAQVVVDWLEGTEPTFGFGKPIVVLAKRGAGPLLEVLDRIDAGAYA